MWSRHTSRARPFRCALLAATGQTAAAAIGDSGRLTGGAGLATALEKTVMNEPPDSVEDREGDSTSEAQHARDAAGNIVDDARFVQPHAA